MPSAAAALDGNITYLRKAKEIHAASDSAEEYAKTLKDACSGRYGEGWVDFSSLLLYGIINP